MVLVTSTVMCISLSYGLCNLRMEVGGKPQYHGGRPLSVNLQLPPYRVKVHWSRRLPEYRPWTDDLGLLIDEILEVW